jgi:hypothetical protein
LPAKKLHFVLFGNDLWAASFCSRVIGKDSSLLFLPQKTRKESNHDSTSL